MIRGSLRSLRLLRSPCSLPAAGLTLWAMLAVGGCADGRLDPAIVQRDQAREEARRLQQENQRLRAQLAQRDDQVRTLQALGDKRLEKLYRVQEIRLGTHTGGVDLDGKPGHDAMKVFIMPADQEGSILKVPGEVLIQLYDLAAPESQNLVAEHRFDIDQTGKAWSSGFLAYHFSFTCGWKSPPKHDEITVRAAFLDYLTGKTFTAQKACRIELPAESAVEPPPATTTAASAVEPPPSPTTATTTKAAQPATKPR